MLDISVRYSNERVAFEKKISKFQAVQHNLARLAGESAAALAAATSAADAIANSTSFDDGFFLEAASAKIRCSEAAEKGAAIAHQVHGAIGFTVEHILHRYSLRALAWRDDFGSESYWAVELGKTGRRPRRRRAVAAGGVALMLSQQSTSFTSPIGRGRIALAIRVRGFARSIDRTPSPQPSPHGRGGAPELQRNRFPCPRPDQ